jgi:hypothetical protein
MSAETQIPERTAAIEKAEAKAMADLEKKLKNKNSTATLEIVKKMGMPIQEGKNYESQVPDSAKLAALARNPQYVLKYIKDQDNELYAIMPDGRVMIADSLDFQSTLSVLFNRAYQKPPSPSTIRAVLLLLYGSTHEKHFIKPRFNGTAMSSDMERTIWYDLCNDAHEVVKITKEGYEVVKEAPVYFYQYGKELPQKTPLKAEAANADVLLKHMKCNVYLDDIKAEKDAAGKITNQVIYDAMKKEQAQDLEDIKLLLAAKTIYDLIPDTPDYSIWSVGLNINGEKGSGKTELMWKMKHISDPMMVGYVTLADKLSDFQQSLIDSAVVAVDNVGEITPSFSDLLCGLSNPRGTLVQKRMLYTNKTTVNIMLKKPAIMTGIGSTIKKTDLADRYIFLDLKRYKKDEVRDVDEMQAEMDKDMPVIMATVFTALSRAMAMYPTYHPKEKSRLGTFDRWGYCIAESLVQGGGESFKRIYAKLCAERDEGMLDEDIVSCAIISIMERGANIPMQSLRDLKILLTKELMDMGYSKNTIETKMPSTNSELKKRILDNRSNFESAGYLVTTDRKGSNTSKWLVGVSKLE